MFRPLLILALLGLCAGILTAQEEMPSKMGRRPAAKLSPEPALPPAAAIKALRQGLKEAKAAPRASYAPLYRAALSAAAELGPDSRNGRRLLTAALKERDAARLGKTIAQVQSDLAFAPVEEADRPTGWPRFTTVGEIEVKRYPRYRMARAAMGSSGDMGAFFRLFNHIKKNEVAMTSPVEMNYEDGKKRAASMAFLYGDPAMGKAGQDGAVEVVDVEPITVISLGLRGNDSRNRVADAEASLRGWLKANPGWEVVGPKRVLSWNSPAVRGQRRFFEVEIPVRDTRPRKL